MRNLALAIDAVGGRFPPLEEVAGWLEALRIRALVPGRSVDAPPPERLRRDLAGIRIAAVRHPFCSGRAGTPAPRALAAADPVSQRAAVDDLRATLRHAAGARAAWTIVELEPPAGSVPADADGGIEARLDRLCRNLHEASSELPELGLALALPERSAAGWTPDAAAAAIEDLAVRRRVAWWHDSGRAAAFETAGATKASAWIDRLAAHCVGLDATDAIGGHAGLPAGSGEIDFAALLGALRGDCLVVVRAEPFQGPGPLLAAADFLRGGRR